MKYLLNTKEGSKGEMKEQKRQKTRSIMADVNPLIPIITLNVNQLNNSIKSQSVNNISIQLENNKRFIFRYYQMGNRKNMIKTYLHIFI